MYQELSYAKKLWSDTASSGLSAFAWPKYRGLLDISTCIENYEQIL